MKYVYIAGEVQISVINILNGRKTVVFNDHPEWETALLLVKTGRYEEFEEMFNRVSVIEKFSATSVDESKFRLQIIDGVASVFIDGKTFPLHDSLIGKIEKMRNDGFTIQPLINFIHNLYQNPSQDSIDELYLFCEKNELPITEDGYLIAYKIVGHNYMDLFSGKFSNKVGAVLEMDRNDVDSNRGNTCSHGLHFCSRGYLPHYGNNRGGNDRCMIVKINPADVVSIPRDYNNAKGRTWKYEVVGELEENWRNEYSKTDYTSKSVVDSKGVEIVHQSNDPLIPLCQEIFNVLRETEFGEDNDFALAFNDTFEQMGFDELDFIEALMTIEDEFGVSIDDQKNESACKCLSIYNIAQEIHRQQDDDKNVINEMEVAIINSLASAGWDFYKDDLNTTLQDFQFLFSNYQDIKETLNNAFSVNLDFDSKWETVTLHDMAVEILVQQGKPYVKQPESFKFDTKLNRWRDLEGRMVSRTTVALESGLTVEEVKQSEK